LRCTATLHAQRPVVEWPLYRAEIRAVTVRYGMDGEEDA
jgi:hypothetical protein